MSHIAEQNVDNNNNNHLVYHRHVCNRLRHEIQYPTVSMLSLETLWNSGRMRCDVLQFIVIQFFHTISPNTFIPTRMIDELENACHTNDEREQVLTRLMALLALIKPNEHSIVRGACDMSINYKFMNQLIDMAVLNRNTIASITASIENQEVSSSINYSDQLKQSFERDVSFTRSIAQNYRQIFNHSCKLFSQDVLSQFPIHSTSIPPPIRDIEQQIFELRKRILSIRKEIVSMEENMEHKKKDSIVRVTPANTSPLLVMMNDDDDEQQSNSLEQSIIELSKEFGEMNQLMQQFSYIFKEEFALFSTNEQTGGGKEKRGMDRGEMEASIDLGKTSKRFCDHFDRLQRLLHSLRTIQTTHTTLTSNSNGDPIMNQLCTVYNGLSVNDEQLQRMQQQIHVLHEARNRK